MIVLPYQRQPVGSIRPNRQNTWLDRATGLWVFSQPYNLITGEPTVLSGSAYFTAAQQGIAARTVPNTGRIQLASDSRNLVPTSGGFTVALHYRKIGAAAATAGFGLDATASAAFRAGTHFPFSDGTLYWDFGGNTAGTNRLTAASLTYGDDFWVFTAGVRGMEIWQNGIRRAQQASAVDWSSNSNPYLLGMHGTATNADDAECAIFLTCARQWSAAECAAWNRETAWDAVEPVVLYVKPSAGGTTGTVNYTNANDTLAASGTTTVVGTLARTNANDTSSASGTTTIIGTSNTTNANDTLAASGSVGGGVDGSLAYTNANDTLSASGTTTVTGTLARTNANDTLSASGWVGVIEGTVDYTNNNDTLSASGFIGDEPVQSGPSPAGSRRRSYYLPNGQRVYATRREVERLLDELTEDQEVVEKAVEVLKTKDTKAARVVLTKVVKYDIEDLPKAVIKQVFEEVTEDMELEAHAHWYINWERDVILRALERML